MYSIEFNNQELKVYYRGTLIATLAVLKTDTTYQIPYVEEPDKAEGE